MIFILKHTIRTIGYGILFLFCLGFISICGYKDPEGAGWIESLNKIRFYGGYALCGEKIVIQWSYRANNDYLHQLKKIEASCSTATH